MSLTPGTVTAFSLPLGIRLISSILRKQYFAFLPENLVWMLERSLACLKMIHKIWWLCVIVWQNFNVDSALGTKSEWITSEKTVQFSDLIILSIIHTFLFSKLVRNHHLHRFTCPTRTNSHSMFAPESRALHMWTMWFWVLVCVLLFHYGFYTSLNHSESLIHFCEMELKCNMWVEIQRLV